MPLTPERIERVRAYISEHRGELGRRVMESDLPEERKYEILNRITEPVDVEGNRPPEARRGAAANFALVSQVQPAARLVSGALGEWAPERVRRFAEMEADSTVSTAPQRLLSRVAGGVQHGAGAVAPLLLAPEVKGATLLSRLAFTGARDALAFGGLEALRAAPRGGRTPLEAGAHGAVAGAAIGSANVLGAAAGNVAGRAGRLLPETTPARRALRVGRAANVGTRGATNFATGYAQAKAEGVGDEDAVINGLVFSILAIPGIREARGSLGSADTIRRVRTEALRAGVPAEVLDRTVRPALVQATQRLNAEQRRGVEQVNNLDLGPVNDLAALGEPRTPASSRYETPRGAVDIGDVGPRLDTATQRDLDVARRQAQERRVDVSGERPPIDAVDLRGALDISDPAVPNLRDRLTPAADDPGRGVVIPEIGGATPARVPRSQTGARETNLGPYRRAEFEGLQPNRARTPEQEFPLALRPTPDALDLGRVTTPVPQAPIPTPSLAARAPKPSRGRKPKVAPVEEPVAPAARLASETTEAEWVGDVRQQAINEWNRIESSGGRDAGNYIVDAKTRQAARAQGHTAETWADAYIEQNRAQILSGHRSAMEHEASLQKAGLIAPPKPKMQARTPGGSRTRRRDSRSGVAKMAMDEHLAAEAERRAPPLDEPTPALRTSLERLGHRFVNALPAGVRSTAKTWFRRIPAEMLRPLIEARRSIAGDVARSKVERSITEPVAEAQEAIGQRDWAELGIDRNPALRVAARPRDAEGLRDAANEQNKQFGDLAVDAAVESQQAVLDMVLSRVIPQSSADAFANSAPHFYRQVAEAQAMREIRPEDVRNVPREIGTPEEVAASLNRRGVRYAENIKPGKSLRPVSSKTGRRYWQSLIQPGRVTDHTKRRVYITTPEEFRSLDKSGELAGRAYVPEDLFFGGHFVLAVKHGGKTYYHTPELNAGRLLVSRLNVQRHLARTGRMTADLIKLGQSVSIPPEIWNRLPAAAREKYVQAGWRPIQILSHSGSEFQKRLTRGLLDLSSNKNGVRYFHPDVADALEFISRPKDGLWDALQASVSNWRELKVVHNPGSHFAQSFGNLVLNIMEGMWPGHPAYKRAWRILVRAGSGKAQDAADAQAFQAFETAGNRAGSLVDSPQINRVFQGANETWAYGRAMRFMRGYRKGAQDLWAFEDNMPKLALFLRDYELGLKRGLSHEQAAREANAVVDRAHPNFARMSKFQRTLAEVIPFSGFETEFARIFSGHVWRALVAGERELIRGLGEKGSLDRWYRDGGRSAVNLGLLLGIGGFINEAMKKEFGIDEREEELLKRQFGRFNVVVPNLNGEGGALQPLTNLFPYLAYFDWRDSSPSAEGFSKVAFSRLLSHPVPRTIGEIASGREWFTDQKIAKPGQDSLLNTLDYLVRQIVPSYLGYGIRPINFMRGVGAQGRFVQAAQGLDDYSGEPMTMGRAALSSLTPLRQQPIPELSQLERADALRRMGRIGDIRDQVASMRARLRGNRITREQAMRELAGLREAQREVINSR